MPDAEKVIKGLECCEHLSGEYCRQCPYHEDIAADTPPCCTGVLAHDALALLKEREARVMTLEEACGAEICWIEVRAINCVSAADIVFDPVKADRIDIYRPGMPDSQLGIDLYGEVWRCWTSRPTDEQREAVKWDD